MNESGADVARVGPRLPPGRPLYDALAVVAHNQPDLVVLVDQHNTASTAATLHRAAEGFASRLAREGIEPSRTVAVTLGAGGDQVAVAAAVELMGARLVLVDPRGTPREQDRALELARPDVVVRDRSPHLSEPRGTTIVVERGETFEPTEAPRPFAASGPGPVLLATAGSTGEPRLALFAPRAVAAACRAGPDPTGPELTTLDLTSPEGFTDLVRRLRCGQRTVFLRRLGPRAVAEALDRHPVTALRATTAELGSLARAAPDLLSGDLVELVVASGGFPSPALCRVLGTRSGRTHLRYGLVESFGVGTVHALERSPDRLDPRRVGAPLGGVRIWAQDQHGRRAAPGEVGELVMATPTALVRYEGDREATRRTIGEGPLRTGDLGRVGADGSVELLGRCSDQFLCDGVVVSPIEVEVALGEHHGVAEVAVVPRPDRRAGAIPVVVMVATDPSDPPFLAELFDLLKDLPHHARPRAQWVVERLPTSGAGRLQRRRLLYEESTREHPSQ